MGCSVRGRDGTRQPQFQFRRILQALLRFFHLRFPRLHQVSLEHKFLIRCEIYFSAKGLVSG